MGRDLKSSGSIDFDRRRVERCYAEKCYYMI